MTSVECFREFINERLSAAAEEIFSLFQKTVVQYEEELHRQRRLLNFTIKHEAGTQSSDLRQQHIWEEKEEEEVGTEQHLCRQERHSRVDHEDSEPQQIKEELEGVGVGPGDEQLVLKQEAEYFPLSATYNEKDHLEGQTLPLNFNEAQSEAERESDGHISAAASFTTMSEMTNNARIGVTLHCEYCGVAFSCKSKLVRHLKIHTGGKPFPCDICGKTFSHPSKLNVHKRCHSGAKPFSCDICGLTFQWNSALEVHRRIHTGERPFSCNVCGKSFNRTSILTVHQRIHTGEKPYSCSICGTSFTDGAMWNRHIKRHNAMKSLAAALPVTEDLSGGPR